MKSYTKESVQIEQLELEYIICDCCGKKILAEDYAEIQEVVSININGGYGSVFGDGSHFEGDFCQNCIKKLLGDYLNPF